MSGVIIDIGAVLLNLVDTSCCTQLWFQICFCV